MPMEPRKLRKPRNWNCIFGLMLWELSSVGLACRCVSHGSHRDQACLFGSAGRSTFMREAEDLQGLAHEPGFLIARMLHELFGEHRLPRIKKSTGNSFGWELGK